MVTSQSSSETNSPPKPNGPTSAREPAGMRLVRLSIMLPLHKLGSRLKSGIFCNMPQHYLYPSPWDRYYYFRPYQYFQVTQLQQTVSGWGQDPHNISDNRFFQGIYDEVDAGAKQRYFATAIPAGTARIKCRRRSRFRQNRSIKAVRAPRLDEPPLKFTQSKKPVDSATKNRAAGDAQPAPLSAPQAAGFSAPPTDPDSGSEVELIRLVVP